MGVGGWGSMQRSVSVAEVGRGEGGGGRGEGEGGRGEEGDFSAVCIDAGSKKSAKDKYVCVRARVCVCGCVSMYA